MDIGSAFAYMFDDQDWIKKIAIGGGITLGGLILSPILIGLALLLPLGGYMLETLKNVRDGRPIPLPEWTDFGSLFSKGLMVAVIGLVYNLPALLVSCASGGLNAFAPQMDSDAAQAIIIAAGCLSCVQIVLSLLGNALLPAALIRYAQYDTLGSGFQFGEIFSFISNNIGDYIIVILLGWVASLIAIFGVILCIIGVLFTGFWSLLVTANLYGQLARKASGAV
ncbi:MAG: DUF4013 domain-containing protein [Chloroflexota bacterium]